MWTVPGVPLNVHQQMLLSGVYSEPMCEIQDNNLSMEKFYIDLTCICVTMVSHVFECYQFHMCLCDFGLTCV